MRKRNRKASKAGKRVFSFTLSVALALGLVPSSAFAEMARGPSSETAASAEEILSETCVIAKSDDGEILSQEPIVSQLGDTYLLGYESREQAEQAIGRLEGICEFAELDRAVVAAAGEMHDAVVAYAGGGDPFTLAEQAVSDNSQKEQLGLGESSDDAAAAQEGSAAQGEAAKAGDLKHDADSSGPSQGESAAGGQDDAAGRDGSAESEEASSGSGDEKPAQAEDGSKVIALVDSGAPRGAIVEKSFSMLGDDVEDENGHAERMLDAIVAQAPSARVMSIRVLDADAIGTVASTYAGIQCAIAQGADIINLSLYAKLDNESKAINAAVADARAAGIVVVAAAGNESDDASGYVPANADDALTVGSCNSDGMRVEKSNYGPAVNMYAVSDTTSIAAATTTGWLAANSTLEDPLRDLASACGNGLFYRTAAGPEDEAEVQSPAPASGASEDAQSGEARDERGAEGLPASASKSAQEDGEGPEAADAGSDAAGSQASAQAEKAEDTLQGLDGGRKVKGAMAISKPTEAELRSKIGGKEVSRVGSPVPKNEVVFDNDGRLPLTQAKLGKVGNQAQPAGLKIGSYKILTEEGASRDLYGVWINMDKKWVTGKNVSVPGAFSLTWTDVAMDDAGNRLDLVLDVSDIVVSTNSVGAKKSPRIALVRNSSMTGIGYLWLYSWLQAPTEGNVAGRIGTTMKVTAHLYKTGTKTVTSSKHLVKFYDVDQPDKSKGASADNNYSGTYVESVRLLSGFNSRTFIQKNIPKTEYGRTNPTWGGSLLKWDTGSGKFTGTQRDLYGEYYRSGMLAQTTSGEFSLQWWGSMAATALLTEYEGVQIWDKNDASKAGVTDQAIITKTTNVFGQHESDQTKAYNASSNHGGKRTSTSWRKTSMPWKQTSTYRFSAKPGFRVSKVQVKYAVWSSSEKKYVTRTDTYTGNDLSGLTKLSFNNSGDKQTYASVRDYQIIVTTAKVDDAEATIYCMKQVENEEFGYSLKAGDFKFDLYDSDKKTKLVKNRENGSSGAFTFKRTYTYDESKNYPITYTYYVGEQKGSNSKISYATELKKVQITVSYSSGKLSATVTGAGKSTDNRLVFKNTFSPVGGVKVKKVDGEEGSKALNGAVFTVYKGKFLPKVKLSRDLTKVTSITNSSGNSVTAVATVTTKGTGSAKGIASLDDLDAADKGYTIVETQAPSGYRLVQHEGDVPWYERFTLSSDGQIANYSTASASVKNYKPPYGGLRVMKVDASGSPLNDAVFSIYEGDVSDSIKLVTTSTAAVTGKKALTTMRSKKTDGQDGIASLPKTGLDADNKTYTVVETQAPAGYKLVNSTSLSAKPWYKVFKLSANGQVQDFTNASNRDVNYVPWRGGVKVKKVDAEGNELAGAVFSVYAGDVSAGVKLVSNQVASVTVDGEEAQPLATMTSGVLGMGSLAATALSAENETYTVVETKAPPGYMLAEEGKTKPWLKVFKLTADGQVQDFTASPVVNYVKPAKAALRVAKELKGKKLEAGEFQFVLEDSAGNEIERASNGVDGVARFGEIAYTKASDVGKTYVYRISEVKGKKAQVVYDETVQNAYVTVRKDVYGSQTVADVRYRRPLEGNAYAVYDEAGRSLRFVRSNETFENGQAATVTSLGGETFTGTVFTGFESNALEPSQIPWNAIRNSVETVQFVDEIRPASTDGWFSGFALLKSCDVAKLDMIDAKSARSMFARCARLRSIDVSSFDVAQVADMTAMFESCTALETIFASPEADWSPARSDQMFDSCSSLVGQNATGYDQRNVTAAYAGVDGLDARKGYFTTVGFSTFRPMATTSSNKLFVNYHANGAQYDAKAGTAITAELLKTSTYSYGASNDMRKYGLNDYTGGTWTLEREGYDATGNWLVGSPTSHVKISQAATFSDTQALAAALGADLSAGAVTLDLYAEWDAGDQASFVNVYSARCDALVKKADAATGAPLEGAVFELCGSGDGAYLYDADGQVVDTLRITSDADGIASTANRGNATAGALVLGAQYQMREIKAPSGYVVDHSDWVTFVADAQLEDGSAFADGDMLGVNFDGSTYRVERASVAQVASGSLVGSLWDSIDIDGNLVAADGEDLWVPLEELGIKLDVPAQAVSAQLGDTPLDAELYAIDGIDGVRIYDYKAFEIGAMDEVSVEVTYEKSVMAAHDEGAWLDSARCGVLVQKVAEGSRKGLAGAVFEVSGGDEGSPLFDEDGNELKRNSLRIETDADGVAETDGLALAVGRTYRIREAAAPDGYRLDDSAWKEFRTSVEGQDNLPSGSVLGIRPDGTTYLVQSAVDEESGSQSVRLLDATDGWVDSPLKASAAVHARKQSLVAVGDGMTVPRAIAKDEFQFQLVDAEGAVVQTAGCAASDSGEADVAFAPMEFGASDAGKTYSYTVREVAGNDANMRYDDSQHQVVISVEKRSSEHDGTQVQELVASIEYPDSAGEEAESESASRAAGPFRNVLEPRFDVRVEKRSTEDGDGDGAKDVLAGAEYALFEVGKHSGSQLHVDIPGVFADEETFGRYFALDSKAGSQSLSFDAAKLQGDFDLHYVTTISTDASGRALTADGALASGHEYAIVETKAPNGYVLNDARNEVPSETVVYLIGDYANDGRYAHVSYQSGQKQVVWNLDEAGEELPQAFGEAWCGYRYVVGADAQSMRWDEAGFVFENPPMDDPMGGARVRKVDAQDGGKGLSGAYFAVYDEDAFASGYRDWKEANPDEPESAFLDYVQQSASGDSTEGAAHPAPLEPVCEMGPSGEDGWASTPTSSSLNVGKTYRIVEISPPAGYKLPAYRFDAPNDVASGNLVTAIREKGTYQTVSTSGDEMVLADEPVEPKWGSAVLTAHKTLAGGVLAKGQFDFALINAQGEELQTASNDEGGQIAFEALQFGPDDVDAEYTYTIREIIPDDAMAILDSATGSSVSYAEATEDQKRSDDLTWAKNGTIYDAHEARATIAVKDKGGKELSCEVVYEEAEFYNELVHEIHGGVRVKKLDATTGEALAGAVFVVKPEGGTDQFSMTTGEDGTAQIDATSLARGSYRVFESEPPEGYKLNSQWSATFSIKDDGEIVDLTASPCEDEPSTLTLPITGAGGVIGLGGASLACIALGLLIRRKGLFA